MVKVQVPATTANFGPGFDCLGASLGMYNFIDMEFSDKPEVYVKGEGAENISLDESNLVYQAASKVLERANVNRPLKIVLENHIPIARGGKQCSMYCRGLNGSQSPGGRRIRYRRVGANWYGNGGTS